ncbi:MAG: hypothetical protein H6Q99_1829 [Proteobacteria bacterium]|nr:hypothetical protein [Pseudomonadota bacterium]
MTFIPTSYEIVRKPRPRSLRAEEYLCWSRMQAEAGQGLEAIIHRKELERRSGGGLFCWGVGNAPAVVTRSLARLGQPIEVIFSVMKGRPKQVDVAPARVVAWRRYIDAEGIVRPLPANVLVTSRADTAAGPKTKHFALMCASVEPLTIRRGEPFDPSMYRNAGGSGAPVGASQVTALLKRASSEGRSADYEVNLRAWLVESYWVQLVDPIICSPDFEAINRLSSNDTETWMHFAQAMRGGDRQIDSVVPPALLF